jgi:DNA polymerase-3 subunit epsilon
MSGRLEDLKKKLAGLFVVDTTNPDRGIQISLPKPEEPPPKPIYGVQIQNGRVVREGRHADSDYANWVIPAGPAETELERKAAAARVVDTRPPIPLDDVAYVVVDTETTGLGYGRGHGITEIAIVRVNAQGKLLHEYQTLVNPGRRIPSEITAITHITNRMVKAAPRFEDIADEVRSLLRDRVFIAHNASFDWGFINAELLRTTGRPLLVEKLCTVRLARKVVPEVRSRSLDSLCNYFNVPNEARHRAYGDARATAVIFRRMLDRAREREIGTWQELVHLTLRRSQKRKRTAMPVGIPNI